MNGYKWFYGDKSGEVYAASLYAAKQAAVIACKAPKSKQHMVSVMLCEKAGEQVVHSAASI